MLRLLCQAFGLESDGNDLRNRKITIRYDRTNHTKPPIVYHNDQRLGPATPVDFLGNDRPPKR